MVNTNFETGGGLGSNITNVDTVAAFTLGHRIIGNEGAEYVYCQANGAITGDGFVVLVDESFQADEINITVSATAFGDLVGVAKAVFLDNEFGFIQIAGTANIRVAASAAANTALNTTAVDGQLDDDATAGSEVVNGIIIATANGGAAGLVEGFISPPTVGATLV